MTEINEDVRKTVVLDPESWRQAETLMRLDDRSFSSLTRRLIREGHERLAPKSTSPAVQPQTQEVGA